MSVYGIKYERLECLGDGAFGMVYKGRKISTGEIVAMKHVSTVDGQGVPSSIMRELCLLKQLNHPNIIKLFDVLYTKDWLILIFEYMDQHLGNYLQTCHDIIQIEQIKDITMQLFKAINYCHTNMIFHRDLKPENILINQDGKLRVTDFGLSRMFGTPSKSFSNEVVTLAYRAPDILLGSTMYGVSIDIWSLGCIFGEIINCGHPLFCGGVDSNKQLICIYRTFGVPNETTWPGVTKLPLFEDVIIDICIPLKQLVPNADDEAFDLLTQLLRMNPKDRILIKDALNHSFLQK